MPLTLLASVMLANAMSAAVFASRVWARFISVLFFSASISSLSIIVRGMFKRSSAFFSFASLCWELEWYFRLHNKPNPFTWGDIFSTIFTSSSNSAVTFMLCLVSFSFCFISLWSWAVSFRVVSIPLTSISLVLFLKYNKKSRSDELEHIRCLDDF